MRKALLLAGALALASIPAQAESVVLSNTPVVQNAAYSASNAMGGWQNFALFSGAVRSGGIINYVAAISKGGSTTAMTVYAFSRSSGNLSSTCTDKSAFSLANADLPYLLPGFPVTLTPATTQGTTVSSASQAIVVSAANYDTARTPNVAVCVVAGGSVTPASVSDLIFNIAVLRD